MFTGFLTSSFCLGLFNIGRCFAAFYFFSYVYFERYDKCALFITYRNVFFKCILL